MLFLLSLLVGCAEPVDVSLRLPEGATIVLIEKSSSTTRTPMGATSLEIKSTKRLKVHQAGRLGTDELLWEEEVRKYEVTFEDNTGLLTWTMPDPTAKKVVDEEEVKKPKRGKKDEEEEEDEGIPEDLAAFAPTPHRYVWVTSDGSIWFQDIPEPPEVDEDEDEDGKGKTAKDAEDEAEPEPPPEPPPQRLAEETEVPSYIRGLALAPTQPVKLGHQWSWTVGQRVTNGGSATTTHAWTLDKLLGSEAVLIEKIVLKGAPPPPAGEFGTSGLSGEGELRFDVELGLPISYRSKYEATLSSPSSIGSSTLRTDAEFKIKASD